MIFRRNSRVWAVEPGRYADLAAALCDLGYAAVNVGLNERGRFAKLDGDGDLGIVTVHQNGSVTVGGRARLIAELDLDEIAALPAEVAP